MLTRRAFVATALAAGTAPRPVFARDNRDGVDFADFRPAGDGVADDGPALARAIEAAAGAPLRLPAGAFLIASPIALDGRAINLVGAGSGRTRLIAATLGSRARGVAPLSRGIFLARRPKSLHLTGLTLDGGVGAAAERSAEGFSRDDTSALVEVSDCGDVVFEDVVTTRNRHARFRNEDRAAREFGRSGPVFALRCSNVRIIGCGATYPCFGEGWWLVDCRKVLVERFRHQGPARFNPAATASPLNVFGPETEDVEIRGCDIANALGSALNLGGKGRFRVTGNRFRGVIQETEAVYGREAARPHDGLFGKGLDLSAEHQEDAFENHPPLRDVIVADNSFENLFSYSAAFNKTAGCPIEGLTFERNRITHGFRGLLLRNAKETVVRGNSFERILRYEGASRPAFGVSMQALDCDGLAIEANVFDGAARRALGRGMGEGVAEIGLLINRSNDVTIKSNSFSGFTAYQLIADVRPDDDRRFGGFSVSGNSFSPGGTNSRTVPLAIGRDNARMTRVTVGDNRFEGAMAGRAEVFAD